MNKIFKKTIFYICLSIILFNLIYYYNVNSKKYIESMGNKSSSKKLNKTLVYICNLLNDNNINDWFICYGTLLGIIRENSCIDGDDDIDIIIDKKHYKTLKNILIKNNFEFLKGLNNNIIKTKSNSKYASIDIYMGDFNIDSVYDRWNKLTINDCYYNKKHKTFFQKPWFNQIINIPNHSKRILSNRYGKEWHIKKDIKVPQSMKQL